ncbi:hypothetical protein JB92DRAFT_3099145 [Gautieria morchelliformis]|nr:hypothetical protein JB92DRAFT_3099145 [Gautieria morchelliformis]
MIMGRQCVLVPYVEYAVSQWTSGIHVKGSNFTEVGYAEVYRRHLSGLEAWRTYSERSGQALARRQQRLHDHGCAHAGFPNIVTNPRKPAFNATKFARAAQALDDDEHSDTTHNMQPWGNATAPYVASLVPHSGWPQWTTNPYGAWCRATAHYVALRWQAVGYGRLHDRGGCYDAKDSNLKRILVSTCSWRGARSKTKYEKGLQTARKI